MNYENYIIDIAKAAHELNRAYCSMIGDNTQLAWEDAPDWQQESAMAGVQAIESGLVDSPGVTHISWYNKKLDDGWKYGPVKDPEKKEHPCMVPFSELPIEQQLKDSLFFQTVSMLLTLDRERYHEIHREDG